MDFRLTEEQRMIQEAARDFAKRELAPHAAEWDRNETFPAEAVKKLAGLGFLGINVPAEYGGAGMDMVSYVLAMEEISAACASTGVVMSVNNSLVCWPLETYATEAQKQKFLVPLAKGDLLGAYCLSEPGAGTDAANQQTRAKRDGDEWVLDGVKNFITNGANADVLIVFAQTDPELKHKGIHAFIVETDRAGFSVMSKEKKLGIRASDTAQLAFDGLRIPADQQLGADGQGFKIAMSTLDGGRIGIASQALGIAKAALEAATEYAKTREQFGKPIGRFQAIQWKIADMAMKYEAARLLTLRAADLKDRGERYSEEAAMAKLFASEAANWIADQAVQIHGGYGYSKEYPVERNFRDARITSIYEGTSEAQRMVIAANRLR